MRKKWEIEDEYRKFCRNNKELALQTLRELPEGTICLNWGYSAGETEDPTRILAQAGAKQYQCPGVCGWNQLLPRMADSHENIRRMAEYGRKYGAAGFLNTDWGDYGHVNDPRFSMPGMAAGACAAWGELPAPEELWAALSRETWRLMLSQPLKASGPMYVTRSGIVRAVRASQPLNASWSM